MARMTWQWRFETAQAAPVNVEEFAGLDWTSRSDAETWIGETWPQLLDAGVDQVVLVEDGAVVYGPMSLHPPAEAEVTDESPDSG